MKAVYIGMLVFVATVGVGLFLIGKLIPTPTAVVVPVPVPTPAAVIQPPKATEKPRLHPKPKMFAKQTTQQPLPLVPSPVGGMPTGPIFSGADPNDPRIYH